MVRICPNEGEYRHEQPQQGSLRAPPACRHRRWGPRRLHRIAAELDGQALLVAGAMSADARIARASAADWFLERAYASYQEMAAAEAADANGIDFVIIATPTDLHFPIARVFLEADIHVICDKPLALTVAEGEELVRIVEAGPTLFALTHPYTGYPAIRQARELVRG